MLSGVRATRAYSSKAGHGPKAQNDAPWVISSIAVFGPLFAYVTSLDMGGDHHDAHGSKGHVKSGDDDAADEGEQEEPKASDAGDDAKEDGDDEKGAPKDEKEEESKEESKEEAQESAA